MKVLAHDDAMEAMQFGRNKQAGKEALQNTQELKKKYWDNAVKKEGLERQSKCLENSFKLLSLEDSFGNLHDEIRNQALELTEKAADETSPHPITANDYQSCMLGTRNAWKWLERLMECSQVHLKHCSEHHQFFHAIKETSEWMPVDLSKAHSLLCIVDVRETSLQANINQKLLLEIKTAITIFLSWQARVCKLLQQSKQLTPVRLTKTPATQPFPAISLADYVTKDICLHEGEEVLVLDNSTSQWKVKNLNEDVYRAPALILLPSGQDADAIEAAMKLCMKFLFSWTEVVRKYGKTIILFLLHVIRVWNSSEKRMLRGLKIEDKKSISKLLCSIRSTFSPFWDAYMPYKTLQERFELLEKLLEQPPDPDYISGENGHLLVIQTIPLEELLSKYKEFWRGWEVYKVLLETTQHPQYLLSVENWKEYKFVDPAHWIEKWMTEMSTDELDYDSIGRDYSEEEFHVERQKQTAESSRIYSSHQEENYTFVITGVKHPNSGERISLDQAVALGIINQSEGKYVNPVTKEAVAIPVAMNSGNIMVERVSVSKSKEQVRDIGLMTITTIKESRPYVLKAVKELHSDRIYSVEEATSMGMLNQKEGTYSDKETGQTMSLADALDCGLLLVEFKGTSPPKEPVVETKTYQINSVLNPVTQERMSFSEAVKVGLIDPSSGAFREKTKGIEMYIGDAIKEGYVRAVVVADPSRIDVASCNRVYVSEERLRHFKKTVLNPLKALRAMKN